MINRIQNLKTLTLGHYISDIVGNNIRGIEAEYISKAQWTNLTNLYLCNNPHYIDRNNIGNNGVKYIAKA